MRPIYTLLAGATILLASCSSSNRVSQTPDDVYYSPGHSAQTATAADGDGQEYYSTAPSDQYVRMKSVDQTRWSYFDDYNNYDSYYAPAGGGIGFSSGYYPAYGYGYGLSSMSIGMGLWDPYFGWNNYFMWNTCYNPYFYNPYYGGSVLVVNGKYPASPVYTHLRAFNPSSYHSNGFVNGNSNGSRQYRPGVTGSSPNNRYYNNTNTYRPAYNNSSGSNGGGQPTRSFTPSSGGGGGGGGFRPGRH
jgi:hypothetical protein